MVNHLCTISIINTCFSNPNSNSNFYEYGSGTATWKTCADNLCKENPLKGICSAVNVDNNKLGVKCFDHAFSGCTQNHRLVTTSPKYSTTASPTLTRTTLPPAEAIETIVVEQKIEFHGTTKKQMKENKSKNNRTTYTHTQGVPFAFFSNFYFIFDWSCFFVFTD